MGYNADGVTFLKDTRGHAGVTGVKNLEPLESIAKPDELE